MRGDRLYFYYTICLFVHMKKVFSMPIICMFDGIKIYIYVERNERHSVPHLHAYYAEHSIVVDFEGNVLEGSLPRKKQAMLIAWTMMHEDELRANYDLMLEGQLPFRIDPLR